LFPLGQRNLATHDLLWNGADGGETQRWYRNNAGKKP
jgi:hypothetical protein